MANMDAEVMVQRVKLALEILLTLISEVPSNHRTAVFQLHSGARLWNNLRDDVKSSDSVKGFSEKELLTYFFLIDI